MSSPNADLAEPDSVTVNQLSVLRLRQKDSSSKGVVYFEIGTNVGVQGYGGPLYPEQAIALEGLVSQLRDLLIHRDPRPRETDFRWLWDRVHPGKPLSSFADGIDPLSGVSFWDTRRRARHTSTGNCVTALSAVDNALWDLRGKLAQQPVCRLLGGIRESLPAYISIMPGEDTASDCRKARELFDKGHTAQKWFFRWGPPDGEAGFTRIVSLAEGLRSELGDAAQLMFDFAVADRGKCDWDVAYAVRVARSIQPFAPKWLEEPFSPEEIESYRRLKGETDIPLSTGEHTYSWWHIKPFLVEGLVSYVQCDPEWCGGVSELLKICESASRYEGIQVVPHGHHVLAAAHVVASQPELLCPMVEHGIGWLPNLQRAQTRILSPEAGHLAVPTEPGLGPDVDWSRFERS